MEKLLDQAHLIDIPMNKPLPTWRNTRVGEATLARRLDRFILQNLMIQRLSHYRQWVGSRGISNHSLIYLEIFGPPIKPKAPFKFNSSWLLDPSYIKLVSNYWMWNPPSQGNTRLRVFVKTFCISRRSLSSGQRKKSKTIPISSPILNHPWCTLWMTTIGDS